jgi:hypothetical protein
MDGSLAGYAAERHGLLCTAAPPAVARELCQRRFLPRRPASGSAQPCAPPSCAPGARTPAGDGGRRFCGAARLRRARLRTTFTFRRASGKCPRPVNLEFPRCRLLPWSSPNRSSCSLRPDPVLVLRLRQRGASFPES